MKFDYQQYEVQPFPGQTEPGIVFRPVLPLVITGTKGQVPCRGLADTGADMTVLPKIIADFVGVTMQSSKPVTARGAGGEIDVSYGGVLLEIGLGKKSHRWSATVGIANQPWEEALWGHAGFLQYFDVTFMGEKRLIQIKRNRLRFNPLSL